MFRRMGILLAVTLAFGFLALAPDDANAGHLRHYNGQSYYYDNGGHWHVYPDGYSRYYRGTYWAPPYYPYTGYHTTYYYPVSRYPAYYYGYPGVRLRVPGFGLSLGF